MRPLVSIVIPAYNHEKFIGETITSCVNQSYDEIEIIIINDGSTDETGSVCKEFARSDERIIYFERENRGAHAAINDGVMESHSEYVAILNSDDVFDHRKIERCLNIMKTDPTVELVFGKIELIDHKSKVLVKGIEVEWLKRAYGFFNKTKNLPLSILNENFVATTSNMFFTKALWKKVGGFQPLRYCHDLDFLLSCIRVGRVYFDMNHTHIKYRIHPSNTIKEDISNIRIEIAAVIAVSLCEYQLALLGDEVSEKSIKAFHEFLNNKDLSALIIFFVMSYLQCGKKEKVYKMLQNNHYKRVLKGLLG